MFFYIFQIFKNKHVLSEKQNTIQFNKHCSFPPTSKRDLRQEALKYGARDPCAQRHAGCLTSYLQTTGLGQELGTKRTGKGRNEKGFGAIGPRRGDNQALTIATTAHFVAGESMALGAAGRAAGLRTAARSLLPLPWTLQMLLPSAEQLPCVAGGMMPSSTPSSKPTQEKWRKGSLGTGSGTGERKSA